MDHFGALLMQTEETLLCAPSSYAPMAPVVTTSPAHAAEATQYERVKEKINEVNVPEPHNQQSSLSDMFFDLTGFLKEDSRSINIFPETMSKPKMEPRDDSVDAVLKTSERLEATPTPHTQMERAQSLCTLLHSMKTEPELMEKMPVMDFEMEDHSIAEDGAVPDLQATASNVSRKRPYCADSADEEPKAKKVCHRAPVKRELSKNAEDLQRLVATIIANFKKGVDLVWRAHASDVEARLYEPLDVCGEILLSSLGLSCERWAQDSIPELFRYVVANTNMKKPSGKRNGVEVYKVEDFLAATFDTANRRNRNFLRNTRVVRKLKKGRSKKSGKF